jgi:prepilin-type N-terminal cleavage/methylation domain-containing protein
MRHSRFGFSLIELMVVMAIVVILGGASVAYVGSYLPRRQVEGAAFQLEQDLRALQTQAVFTRHTMEIRFLADATHNEYVFETKPGGFDPASGNFGCTMTRTLTGAAGFPVFVKHLATAGSTVYLADGYEIPSATTLSLFFTPFGVPAVDTADTAISLNGADVFIVAPSGAEVRVHVSPVVGQISMVWQ